MRRGRPWVAAAVAALLPTIPALAQQRADAPRVQVARDSTPHDGSHDFDWGLGVWHTHLRRLVRPLTGSTTWVEYDGTTTTTPIWNGKASLVELVADGSAGHIEALALRLYNPDTRQWSLNFSNPRTGVMATPTVGAFRDGRGEFTDREELDGRPILLRFVITVVSPTEARYEQSFSADGGRTWELNWVAVDTRTMP